MTAEIIEFGGDSPFGYCPRCRRAGEFVYLQNGQYCVCHQHRVRWLICVLPPEDAPAFDNANRAWWYRAVEPFDFPMPDDGEPIDDQGDIGGGDAPPPAAA